MVLAAAVTPVPETCPMAVTMFEAWVELLFEIANVPVPAVPLLPRVNGVGVLMLLPVFARLYRELDAAHRAVRLTVLVPPVDAVTQGLACDTFRKQIPPVVVFPHCPESLLIAA